MTCDFASFSKVFQSYQDDERLIMEGLCNGIPFMVEKISPGAGLEVGILDQQARAYPTKLPGLLHTTSGPRKFTLRHQ